jgi:bifunctional pyridoxal-dependent enzyme with beta-cystathionase and maltose regulon repressor activities
MLKNDMINAEERRKNHMNNQYGQKEQALIDLCSQNPLDMERFMRRLTDGVDVNASLGDEENLLLDVLWELIWHKNKARIIDVIHLFLDAGSIFGAASAQFYRFNIACPRSILEQAFDQLKEAMDSL